MATDDDNPFLGYPNLEQTVNTLRARRGPPIVRTRLQTTQRTPILFSCSGEAGSIQLARARRYSTFRGAELFAFDTSPKQGHGTVIDQVFIGNIALFGPVPTWIFYDWLSTEDRKVYEDAAKLVGTVEETPMVLKMADQLRRANAALTYKWRHCEAGIDMMFAIKFEVACKWEAVLWADELR